MATTNQFMGELGAAESSSENAREDLFALTDEQILEIVAEDAVSAARDEEELVLERREDRRRAATAETPAQSATPRTEHGSRTTSQASENNSANQSIEPPQWLANMMADPQAGGEARDFWNGIQVAQQEAAAFRAVAAKPEEARVAVERARVLDDIDRAYFGTAESSPEQLSSARAQLAERMLQQDPAAFREMVFAGLRALESAGAAAGANKNIRVPGVQTTRNSGDAATSAASLAAPRAAANNTEQDARVAAYAAFEKAANEDLARSVGTAIDRTLEQALPNAAVGSGSSAERAQRGAALKERLSGAIRQDVEKTLQGDRQLGEQVAQILAGRRLDEHARAQVVRLIGERAQQLVPSAAKRVLQDWTQSTLSAHRGQQERTETTTQRREMGSTAAAGSASNAQPAQRNANGSRETISQNSRGRIDYRRLSDEQILNS